MIVERNALPTPATNKLASILQQNRAGQPVGVFSICSANRFVLEAGIFQALRDQSLLLIESTSNQVNQLGGYAGQTPADFAAFVHALARENKFPVERIVLGGDHLGPHVWRKESAAAAMEKGCVLVRDYVRAGYTKIHLDASMRCADDPPDQPLSDEIISQRTALLCQAAEAASAELPPGAPAPLYVVGTEVPTPGGAHSGAKAPEVTRIQDLQRTLQLTEAAFRSRKLDAAWERVIAVVVQPGVEFGDSTVSAYDSAKAQALSEYVEKQWAGVYEAHSTDYQSRAALRQMIEDHFAILKVGPWLTFAFREAIFALEDVEREWLGSRKGMTTSDVRAALERAMLDDPSHWKDHYHGNAEELRFARKYSLSDRARYYWPQRDVSRIVQRLISNLTADPPPVSLLSQYLPFQYDELQSGKLGNRPVDMIRSKIMQVLNCYASACGLRPNV